MDDLVYQEIRNIKNQLDNANRQLEELYKGDFEPFSEEDVQKIDEIGNQIDVLVSQLQAIIKNI